MIKRFILLAFFSLAFLLPERTVGAQTTIPNTTAPANSNLATATPTIAASLSQTSVKTIVAGITDYTDRLMNINQKISTRLEKLKKAKIKTNLLVTKYNNLNRQLQLLKTEVNKTQSASTSFLTSRNKQKDYAALKKQLTRVQNALKSTLASEKEIVTEMSKYGSISATPTVIIKK